MIDHRSTEFGEILREITPTARNQSASARPDAPSLGLPDPAMRASWSLLLPGHEQFDHQGDPFGANLGAALRAFDPGQVAVL